MEGRSIAAEYTTVDRCGTNLGTLDYHHYVQDNAG